MTAGPRARGEPEHLRAAPSRPTSGSSPAATCSGSAAATIPASTSRSASASTARSSTRCAQRSTTTFACAAGTCVRWEVGSSATPADLVDRLLELGLVEDDEPLRVGMALTEPPPAVRRTSRCAGPSPMRIAASRPGSPRRSSARRTRARRRPTRATSSTSPTSTASRSAGRPARSASMASRSSARPTLPEARGRGAYRALVRARWDDAVARGTPLAVTDAGRQSRPILARLGFRELCTIHALVDRV